LSALAARSNKSSQSAKERKKIATKHLIFQWGLPIRAQPAHFAILSFFLIFTSAFAPKIEKKENFAIMAATKNVVQTPMTNLETGEKDGFASTLLSTQFSSQPTNSFSPSSSSLTLRKYQEEAVERAILAKRSTIKAPTGTGKTIIAISWLERIGKEALIVVPTQALIYQSWTPKLVESGYRNVGLYYAYVKRMRDPVTITTFASAILRPNLLLDRAEAVVVDEVHHLGSKGALRRLLPRLKEKEYVLGLSSVPEREDNSHSLFLKEFPISYELGLGDAIRNRYVSPLRIINVPAKMTDKELQDYKLLTGRIQRAFRFCGPDLTKWSNRYDPNSKQFVGRLGMWSLVKRKKLLSDVMAKKEEVLKIIRAHPDERIILFSESVPAIEHLRKYLIENEVNCETFHAGTFPWRKEKIFEEWGNEFQVLLSCRALDEGIDVKEVGIGILLTNGKSKRQFVQRIGRIIRPMEGKKAEFYVVYSPDTVEERYFKTISKILISSVPTRTKKKKERVIEELSI
jgi:superfamily II DNA or RNA helicase